MAEEGPNNKVEIQEIFRRLRQNSANRTCFDCGAKAPTWSSVTYGVFICIDCSAVHRSLGVHLSFVRSTQLDTNWTWTQLRCMQLGGNANAQAFFSQHHSTSSDAQQKYNSRAAQLYREKLNQMVAKHNKLHGHKISFDYEEAGEVIPEKDFFEHMKEAEDGMQDMAIDSQARLDLKGKNGAAKSEQEPGPSVDGIASSGGGSAGPRKATIGTKRPGNKLGAKKLGMGAQKVKADFSAIEKEAEMQDEMKEQKEAQAKVDASNRAEEEERQKASMSLTYQEISKQQKKREELLKHADPKKAEQVERLGMGVGVRAGVSHSVLSQMQEIVQETPTSASSSKPKAKFDSFFDDYEIVETNNERGSSFMSSFDSYSKRDMDFDFDRPSKPKVEEDEFMAAMNSTSRPKTKEPSSTSSASFGMEAQKKFGNAKAISSDQMFGDSRDNDYERRSNLSRFEGKSSISSSEYFGTGDARNAPDNTLQALQNVDLDDVKESFRQGVNKVGGRLVTLANGMMSSLQEKYGY